MNQADKKITIRTETPVDRQAVEALIRRAFYNQYIPGCAEHYLVRTMRPHPDFLPELDLVLELDGEIIGSVMYTKARLEDAGGASREILTFGPLCVAPEHQRRGYGKQLLEHSFRVAQSLGYDTIVIFGSPANYVARGFQSCLRHRVQVAGGTYPAAMLVKELRPGALAGGPWTYYDSPVMQLDEQAALRYDDGLESMERRWQPSQEEFFILSRATLTEDAPQA